jgi:ketosteroid isomerase-like protein
MVSDVEQLRDLLHPDVTWIGFPGDDVTPICRSKAEATARLDAFIDGARRVHPEILEQSDERMVVRMHLDSPAEGIDLHQVLTLRDGLVWLIEDYPERP